MPTEGIADAGISRRLGYLFKHAHHSVQAANDAALAPLGIDSRELGILVAIANAAAASQHEVAQRMGIDRTTMVAFLDQLEAKGLLARRPDPRDRRRNVVELTPEGETVLPRAVAASDAAEAELLAALGPQEAEQLRELLARVVASQSAQAH